MTTSFFRISVLLLIIGRQIQNTSVKYYIYWTLTHFCNNFFFVSKVFGPWFTDNCFSTVRRRLHYYRFEFIFCTTYFAFCHPNYTQKYLFPRRTVTRVTQIEFQWLGGLTVETTSNLYGTWEVKNHNQINHLNKEISQPESTREVPGSYPGQVPKFCDFSQPLSPKEIYLFCRYKFSSLLLLQYSRCSTYVPCYSIILFCFCSKQYHQEW